jgi:hypothetical protein
MLPLTMMRSFLMVTVGSSRAQHDVGEGGQGDVTGSGRRLMAAADVV